MGSDIPCFTFLDHTADMGIRVRGKNLEILFKEAARSMIHIMMTASVAGKVRPMKFEVSAHDLPDLMVRWLGEILYLFQGENRVIVDIEIASISPTRLEASLLTVPFDPAVHEVQTEIKAVTYHQIEVRQRGRQWEATIIFDL